MIFNTRLRYFTCSLLAEDGERVYMITDKTGSPNVIVKDLFTGKETHLTDHHKGIAPKPYDGIYTCKRRWKTLVCSHTGWDRMLIPI